MLLLNNKMLETLLKYLSGAKMRLVEISLKPVIQYKSMYVPWDHLFSTHAELSQKVRVFCLQVRARIRG